MHVVHMCCVLYLHVHLCMYLYNYSNEPKINMKSTKVQTLGARAVAGAWLAG